MLPQIRRTMALLIALAFGLSRPARAQETKTTPPCYEEEVSASNPLRTEQAKELDAYVEALKRDSSRLSSVVTPDYDSPKAYEAFTKRLRQW